MNCYDTTTLSSYTSALQAQALSTYRLRVISGVTEEPITLTEARKHLRIPTYGSPPSSDEDIWLEPMIGAAREYCEHLLGAGIGQQTLEISLTAFPSTAFALPFGPVNSIASITYLDADNEEQTVDAEDYAIDAFVNPQRLTLAYGATWPTALDFSNSVRIRYTVGYALPGDSPQTPNPLPKAIRAAMLLVLGHLYENREATIGDPSVTIQTIPMGVVALLERYRVRLSMA